MNFFTPPYREILAGVASPDFSRFHRGLRGDRFEIFPVLSRSINIGSVGGMHEKSRIDNNIYDWAGAENRVWEWEERDNFVEISQTEDLRRLCNAVRFRADTHREMCRAVQ